MILNFIKKQNIPILPNTIMAHMEKGLSDIVKCTPIQIH